MAKELKKLEEDQTAEEQQKEPIQRIVVKEIPTATEKVFYDNETEEVFDLTTMLAKIASDVSLIKKQFVGK